MKKQVIDYKVLFGESVSDMEGQVRAHVQQQEGWKPCGSLVIDGKTFYQTIMRVQKS